MVVINDLPNNILYEIFLYIEFVNRQRLELVCKQWRWINQRIWQREHNLQFTLTSQHSNVYLKHDQNGIQLTSPNIRYFEAVLLKFNGSLIKLDINDDNNNSRCKIPDTIWKLIHQNKNLTSVRIAVRNNNARKSLLKYLPIDKLEHLSIDNMGGSGPLLNNLIETLLKNTRKLTFLHISFVSSTSSVLEIISEMDTLKALYLGDVQGSSTYFNPTKLINLEVLSIENGKLINDIVLCELAASCRKLQAIDLKNCESIKGTGIKAIGSLPNLRYVNLDKISWNIKILEYFSNLDEFYCNLICLSKDLVLNFLERSPKLKQCYFHERFSAQCSNEAIWEETHDWFDRIVSEAGFYIEWCRPGILHFINWQKIFRTVNQT